MNGVLGTLDDHDIIPETIIDAAATITDPAGQSDQDCRSPVVEVDALSTGPSTGWFER